MLDFDTDNKKWEPEHHFNIGTVNQPNYEQADVDNNEVLVTPVKFHSASPHENTCSEFENFTHTHSMMYCEHSAFCVESRIYYKVSPEYDM